MQTVSRVEPKVGMGATRHVGSDSYPYTITKVSKSGRKIWVIPDYAEIVSGSFQTGNAEVKIVPTSVEGVSETELGARLAAYTLRLNGRWCEVGAEQHQTGGLVLNQRRYYLDPDF